ncbi:transposase [Pseudoalteromonas rhizosphaerae]|uniref:transposase n=1 Tax=Pseudoalteromonas rhizosphaerae TaxID=2518973 RepID=UPI003CCC60C7
MTTKKSRKTHTTEFKQEAVLLAAKIGVAATARDLDIHESQIYDWRNKLQQKKRANQPEAKIAAELAKLKGQISEQSEDLAILKKATSYSAKNQK